MPMNTESTVNPGDLLREMDALSGKAGEAIDQLLAQRRAILEAVQARTSELDAQIQRLNELYKTANGRYYIPPAEGEADTRPHRTYRRHSELVAYANEIVAFVASRSPDGVSGAAINERFPAISGGSIRAFVEKYAGVQLRDNGASRADLRYLPPA